jgi:hypothetical protein
VENLLRNRMEKAVREVRAAREAILQAATAESHLKSRTAITDKRRRTKAVRLFHCPMLFRRAEHSEFQIFQRLNVKVKVNIDADRRGIAV